MKRNDIHRPSAINPTEYQWVGFECIKIEGLGDCYYLQAERKRIREHMARTGGTYSRHEHGGNCMVCGNANATYTILFYHELTNTYVRMGNDCAQKCDMASGGDIDAFKTAIKGAKELHAGKRKAEATLAEAGFTAAWTIYTAEFTPNMPYEESTIRDIVGKLVKYGSVSEKSLNYVGVLLNKITNRAEIEAQRTREREAAAVLPTTTGRVDIEGTVLTTRIDPSAYGDTLKMLVAHSTGWKVWGTCPASLDDVKRGDVVRFSAIVKPSPDDPKFGFFSRPTKGVVLVRATTPAVSPAILSAVA